MGGVANGGDEPDLGELARLLYDRLTFGGRVVPEPRPSHEHFRDEVKALLSDSEEARTLAEQLINLPDHHQPFDRSGYERLNEAEQAAKNAEARLCALLGRSPEPGIYTVQSGLLLRSLMRFGVHRLPLLGSLIHRRLVMVGATKVGGGAIDVDRYE